MRLTAHHCACVRLYAHAMQAHEREVIGGVGAPQARESRALRLTFGGGDQRFYFGEDLRRRHLLRFRGRGLALHDGHATREESVGRLAAVCNQAVAHADIILVSARAELRLGARVEMG